MKRFDYIIQTIILLLVGLCFGYIFGRGMQLNLEDQLATIKGYIEHSIDPPMEDRCFIYVSGDDVGYINVPCPEGILD